MYLNAALESSPPTFGKPPLRDPSSGTTVHAFRAFATIDRMESKTGGYRTVILT